LLLVWEEEHCNGRDLPAAELCRDCPELAEELNKRIGVLRQMYFLVQRKEAADPSTESHAEDAAVHSGAGTWVTGSVSGGAGGSFRPPGGPRSGFVPRPESVPGCEILGEVGRGGMGGGYHARPLELDRPAALKIILHRA